MATRLWMDYTNTPPVSPTPDAFWDGTTGFSRKIIRCGPTLYSTNTGTAVSETSANSGEDYLITQFISQPLIGDQTISGTIKALLRARESSTSMNAHAQMLVKVVSNDGSTVRGTLYGGDSSGSLVTEFTSSSTNYYYAWFPTNASSGVSLSSVSALDGDRIVIECGYREFNTSTTSMSCSLNFYSQAVSTTTDATTAGATSSTSNQPWFEFSQDLAIEGRLLGSTDLDISFSGSLTVIDPKIQMEGETSLDIDLSGSLSILVVDFLALDSDDLDLDMDLSGDIGFGDSLALESNDLYLDVDLSGNALVTLFLSGSTDLDIELAGNFSRGVFASKTWSAVYFNGSGDGYAKAILTPVAISLYVLLDSELESTPDPTIPVPPPRTHTDPPEPGVPDIAETADPEVNSYITIRPLYGVIVDMDEPTISGGKPV